MPPPRRSARRRGPRVTTAPSTGRRTAPALTAAGRARPAPCHRRRDPPSKADFPDKLRLRRQTGRPETDRARGRPIGLRAGPRGPVSEPGIPAGRARAHRPSRRDFGPPPEAVRRRGAFARGNAGTPTVRSRAGFRGASSITAHRRRPRNRPTARSCGRAWRTPGTRTPRAAESKEAALAFSALLIEREDPGRLIRRLRAGPTRSATNAPRWNKRHDWPSIEVKVERATTSSPQREGAPDLFSTPGRSGARRSVR
jgi:hypothetical protein